MSSFYAELHLDGQRFPVVHCSFELFQATDARGRAATKVRHGQISLTLDVPDDELLLTWAATVSKPLDGHVVFSDPAGGGPRETLGFTAGECVHYQEDFVTHDTGQGAYRCHLRIAARKLTLQAGGPATAYLPPAPRDYAAPVAAAVAQAAVQQAVGIARETSAGSPERIILANRPTPNYTLSPDLARMLKTNLIVATSGGPDGPPNFEELVKADLQAIYDTPSGKLLLDSLHVSGKKTCIHYDKENDAEYNPRLWERAFYNEDGKTPGEGLPVTIHYNPSLMGGGNEPWQTRPPGIGLVHELIHAEQIAYGRMRRGTAENSGGADPKKPNKPATAFIFELETVGVPPYDGYAFNENKIRSEWNPPQKKRTHY